MNGTPIRIPHETGLLLALQRVRAGHVVLDRSDVFTDRGRPFPRVLVPFLRELLDHGQAWLSPGDDGTGDSRLVTMTDAGEALLTELASKPDGTTDESSTGRSTSNGSA